MKLGNGKWEHTNFTNRLQPTQIGLGTSGTDSSLLKLDYGYGTTTNNGNVTSQTITAPKASGGNLVLTQTYTYDTLNRLLSAGENGSPSWTQNYDYDRYGNRAVNPSSTLIPNPTLTPTSLSSFSTTTNRITLTGFGYDAAGNIKNDPTTTPNPPNGMTYDGENRQVSYTKANAVTSYAYDGDGHRVKKIAGSVTTVFVYNAGGQLTAEYTNDTTPPVGGGGTSYLTSDHLGSTRLVTSADGSVKARYDYLPFGEEIPSNIGSRSGVVGYGGVDSTRQRFTQKERDSESGLDYFGARYYSSAQGRFTSVDPITVTFARMVDPQQMSLYAYARNNPLVFVDPTGMIIDTSRLSEDDLKKWQQVVAIANATDEHGNYTNATLHAEYERLQSDTEHTFFIENYSTGERSGEAGRFTITKFNGDGDFSEATIRLDFKKIKNMESSSQADLVPGFKKFEGLFGVKNEQILRLAELFGHEAAHAVFALDHRAESVALERLTSERDAMIAALPKKHRYPLPPDIQEKFARADRDLVPTERYAQQQEKIINGELRASQRKRK